MKRGNYTTGTTNSIPFKCTQCGFFDPMETDICDSLMLPEDVLQKISKAE